MLRPIRIRMLRPTSCVATNFESWTLGALLAIDGLEMTGDLGGQI